MDQDALGLVTGLAVMTFVTGCVVVWVVMLRRLARQRLARLNAAAAQYGYGPVNAPMYWLRAMPEYPSRGRLSIAYAGQRGGRPVVVAEYTYSPITVLGRRRRYVLAVAAVRLATPRPPQNGHGRLVPWRVTGPDVIATCNGMLDIAAIQPIVDDLLGVAAWLDGTTEYAR